MQTFQIYAHFGKKQVAICNIKESHTFYRICAWVLTAQLLRHRYRCGRSGAQLSDGSNRHSVADRSPSLRRFFGAVLPRR